jgi:hypothetical protein
MHAQEDVPVPGCDKCLIRILTCGGGVPVQALALMAAFRDEWPCLIIVPSSLRGPPRVMLLLLPSEWQ